jgi:hypothetical protein
VRPVRQDAPRAARPADRRGGGVHTLEGFFANEMDVAVGAGSVWVSSADGSADAVLKSTPSGAGRGPHARARGVPTSLAFGHGSVWVAARGATRCRAWTPEPARWSGR